MLTITNLKNYCQQVQQAIPQIKVMHMAVSSDNLVRFMNDHSVDQNTLMVALVPEHSLNGEQDSARWENNVGFYFLEKTDYSQHDNEGFLSIFERTQEIAMEFVRKLVVDKSENTGLFCNFLAFFNENSVQVRPVVALNGCNGYYVEFLFESYL